MTKLPKVAICFPSSDMVHADFALALAGLCAAAHPLGVVTINPKSSIVAVARNNGVARAQEIGADVILFLDSDMTFPPTVPVRLMAHRKAIVGAIYTKRLPPYELLGTPISPKAEVGEDGLVEMKRLPTGCLMIAMKVFEHLKRPYFRFGADEETGAILGEDYAFCDGVRLAGFHIWADMTLSREIGHIGQHICRVPGA
jgi:hypothetical protein